MKRRVAVFTSSRADLGPLGPVIAALDDSPDVELVVIATGTHSTESFGGRLGDIRVTGTSTVETVDAEIVGTEPADLARASGRITVGVSDVLTSQHIDILVLLGDRWELLAAAAAALLHGVPVAHLHGGETTEGAIDERIRHSITKLADLHLCASVDSARRIRQLGEEPRRIVVTGAPGLDRIADVEPLPDAEIGAILGFEVRRPLGVVVYHPETVDRVDVRERARTIFDVCARRLGAAMALYPGADPGTSSVAAELADAACRHDNFTDVKNLGNRYLSVLAAADVLIGNSSSGIIEAASLSLPVVNIGDRQRGRLRPQNVIDVPNDQEAIDSAIEHACSHQFRAALDGISNPYGDGAAANRILEAILEAPLDDLLRKPLISGALESHPVEPMIVPEDATLRAAIEAISRGRAQMALVATPDRRLIGTVSDGDVRRALLDGATLESPVSGLGAAVPIIASPTDSPEEILAMMQRGSVSQVPVVDDNGRVIGLHLMRTTVTQLADDRWTRRLDDNHLDQETV